MPPNQQNSNLQQPQANNISPFKVYTLIAVFLILAVMAMMPSINKFRYISGCEGFIGTAKEYGTTVSSCSQYFFQKYYIVPAVLMPLPSLFIILVLFLKEKKKEYQLIKAKQEKIAFLFSILTFSLFWLFFKLTFIFEESSGCEGFGCLPFLPLYIFSFVILPSLFFGFSLWFLKARYQWIHQKFVAVTIVLIVLLVIAFFAMLSTA